MKEKQRNYQLIVTVLVALAIVTSCLTYYFVRQAYLDKEKAVIGVLYNKDSKLADDYAKAMFETDISKEEMKAGEQAMNVLGYTSDGFTYMEKRMDLTKCLISVVMHITVLILLYLVFLWFRREQQKYKTDLAGRVKLALSQENGFTKTYDDEATNVLENQITQALEMLTITKQYAQKLNKQMQQFIENIAHQIKTPLSGTYIALELLQEGAKEDKLHKTKYEEKIEECFYHLDKIKGLLKRLMDIGRLEAGKILFVKDAVLLDELLEEIVQTIPGGTNRVQIVKEEESYEYHCDYDWMREALANIVSNSLEHSKGLDSVKVVLEKKREHIAIHIRDKGEGISPKDLPFIFDRFYLPEHVKTSHTGIGLNLAKLVIEAHHGQIYAANAEDGGAVFHIILPIYMLKR